MVKLQTNIEKEKKRQEELRKTNVTQYVNPAAEAAKTRQEEALKNETRGAFVSTLNNQVSKEERNKLIANKMAQDIGADKLATQVGTAPVVTEEQTAPKPDLTLGTPALNNTPAALALQQATGGLDVGQALGSSLLTAGAGAAGGAVAGLATGGVASVPLAVVGAIGGFLTGVISNLRAQANGEIAARKIGLTDGSKNLRAIIQDTNGGGNAAENLELFNYQMYRIDQEYEQLQRDIITGRRFGIDGTEQMAKFEAYYSRGGMREYLIGEMQQALLNPNPSKQLITEFDLV